MSLSKLSSPSSSTFIDYSMPIGTWVRVTGTEFYMDAAKGVWHFAHVIKLI